MRLEAQRLQDIKDAIAAIERYTSQGRQAFDEQELIQGRDYSSPPDYWRSSFFVI